MQFFSFGKGAEILCSTVTPPHAFQGQLQFALGVNSPLMKAEYENVRFGLVNLLISRRVCTPCTKAAREIQ